MPLILKDEKVVVHLEPGIQFPNAHTHFCPDNNNCIFIVRYKILRKYFIYGALIGMTLAISFILLLYNLLL